MTTLKTGMTRLLKLADFLDTLKRKDFDFGCWVGDGLVDTAFEAYNDVVNQRITPGCGTTACALGWATAIPSLRRAGLRLAQGEVCLVKDMGKEDYDRPERAAAEVFGLSDEEFQLLFTPGYPDEGCLPEEATAKQVAKHIRKFVKSKLAEA